MWRLTRVGGWRPGSPLISSLLLTTPRFLTTSLARATLALTLPFPLLLLLLRAFLRLLLFLLSFLLFLPQLGSSQVGFEPSFAGNLDLLRILLGV
jgi:hypothetical protein